MMVRRKTKVELWIFATFCLMNTAGQEYILTGPASTQYIPNNYNNQNGNINNNDFISSQFRHSFPAVDSYLPQRDLQTSDLPFFLQQTLPQYRATTKTPPPFDFNNLHSSRPAPFRPIIPSTHRPNYSHLFQNRNRQTTNNAYVQEENEKLGEPERSNNNNVFEDNNRNEHLTHQIQGRNNNNNSFLNHRTRILSPETNNKLSRPQTKDYFVNNDGEVFITTKSPVASSTVSPVDDSSQEDSATSDYNIDTLLGEPIGNQQPLETETTNPLDYEDYEEEEEDAENPEEKNELTSRNNNGIRDKGYDDLGERNESNEDSNEEDYNDDDPIAKEESNKGKNDSPPMVTTTLTPEEIETETLPNDPEPVVSVVTTKSVINHTVIATSPEPPMTKDIQATPPTTKEENTTDTWVVVASVQTSRSVSGAHYLPSHNVEQTEEKVTLLNDEEEPKVEQTTGEQPTTTEVTTTSKSSPVGKQKTSTESLIDKLDRVQSDLSSAVLIDGFKNDGNNIAVLTEMSGEKVETTSEPPKVSSPKPLVNIRKFSALARPTLKPKRVFDKNRPRPSTTTATTTSRSVEALDKTFVVQDVSKFLPPGYKAPKDDDSSKLLADILSRVKPKDTKTESTTKKMSTTSKTNDISAFLPLGYKPPGTTTTTKKPVESLLSKVTVVDDISALLPPGFKESTATTTSAKPKGIEGLLKEAKPMDITAFLPPGYRASYKTRTTQKPLTTMAEKVPTSLLPPGFKVRDKVEGTTQPTTSTSTTKSTTAAGFKIVFPSRPGNSGRKSPSRLTTPKISNNLDENKVTPPTIQKGWPSRATTEFTGWPTPSTTPISIEKLLEAARIAHTSTTEASETTVSTTTTTTPPPTTTTPKPTTPGVCQQQCDLAGTIKLVSGVKWSPELIDRNTEEWQILANEVELQLKDVFSRSNVLNKWYKKIRIDGFSEGSVLVDYLVELNDVGRRIDTGEIKTLFLESLQNEKGSNRAAKSLVNETQRYEFGDFVLDPRFTDFVVLPKQANPTVGYAEDNILLPQWAIAVIVIGLASLLFVIIFGVTVLVNRQKNAKKKAPIPLTDDMLNELNKSHMGGFDNYGVDDLYNVEDGWDDSPYEPKLHKKKSSGSIHDNSMSNLYDSWRSEWNGHYHNAYYGNNAPGSSHGGYRRKKSDYDTNF